ncbi:MAG: efflux RND transporter periplasmic adaptor subunit [Gammaproteobacteria bacterium]|nr:efflux RND transporter periplasmic adaptor subunit [Gammaproteobacteria bacterium]
MRRTYITALAIAFAIGIWLLSGQIGSEDPPPKPTPAELAKQRAAMSQDRPATRVRARVIHATPQFRQLRVRGKTENKRTVQVRAELTGTIVQRPVERGSRVTVGDLLCRISIEDREAGLKQATEALNQARLEYDGSLELRERGLLSETAIAQASARLASAEAELKRSELDFARTHIEAPFNGIVEDVHLEVGDYVNPGSPCATIVDLDPMLLVGRISESDVLRVTVGQQARGTLSDGRQVAGAISFVGQQSDPDTRTYRIEIPIPNPAYDLRSGITTEISVPVAEIQAQHISPALFALDDAGVIGVRTIGDDGRVRFYPVDIVREDATGVWVSGLPPVATLITVGQELVVPGEYVEVDFEHALEMPAAAPTSTTPGSEPESSHTPAHQPASA